MTKLLILNTREVKKIKEAVMMNYNYFLDKGYAFLKNQKNKLFIINKDLSRINIDNLRVDKIGLYFGELKGSKVRLSKEGAQLLALEARKRGKKLDNTVELTKKEVKKYFAGDDLKKDLGEENRYVILQYGRDVFGCASYKNGVILNFMPKIHRGEVIL